MEAIEYRLEVWNTDRSSRLGIIPRTSISDSSYFEEEVNGIYELSLEYVANFNASQYIVVRNHIFVQKVGNSETPKKFRIKMVDLNEAEDGTQKYNITCEHITFDLINEVIPITTRYAGLSCGILKTKIMAGSAFTNGANSTAIDNFIIEEFIVGGANRLDLLKQLADKTKGRLVVQDDLSVKILVKNAISTTTPSAYFTPKARNSLSLKYSLDSGRLVTRMYAIGSGEPRLTLNETWHPVEASSSAGANQISLRIFKLGTSASCWTTISSGGPANNRRYYILSRYNKSYFGTLDYYKVLAFTPEKDGPSTADEIIIEDSAPRPAFGFITDANGQTDVALYYSDSGTDYVGPFVAVDFIEDRENYNNYFWVDGISESSDIEFSENLVIDPFFTKRSYVSGKHPSISSLGSGAYILPAGAPDPTYTKNTDLTYVRNGLYSQRVQTDRFGQGCYIVIDPQFKSNLSEYFSIKVIVYLNTGKLRAEVIENSADRIAALERKNVFPPANTSDPIEIISTGQFHELTFTGIINNNLAPVTGYTGIAFVIFQNDQTNADFYIDSIQCEPLPYITDKYIEGTSKKNLWNQAYDEMKKVRELFKVYEFRSRDVFAAGLNSYMNFSAGDVISFKNSDLGINEKLWCNKKKTNILDPSDIEIELNTRVDSEPDRAADAYLQLKRQAVTDSEIINSRIKERNRLTISKAASSLNVNSNESKISTPSIESFSDSNGMDGKIIWAGKAHHGCLFLDNLVVPEGRKVVFIFTPTVTSIPSSGALGQVKFNDDFSTEMVNNPSLATMRVLNGSSFSIQDDNTIPIQVKFIKIFIGAGLDKETSGLDDWHSNDSPTFDNSNAFTSWIPPGNYDHLILFAYGEAGATGKNLVYAGPLVLIEVPLRRSFLSTYDLVPGDTYLTFKNSTTGPTFPFSINGLVKVGVGPTQEIIPIRGQRPSTGGVFDLTSKYTETHMPLVYAHSKGEQIEEYREGVPNGFHPFITVAMSPFSPIAPSVSVS